MNARAPRLTWPDPDRAVRGGGVWFVASSGRLRAPWRISAFVAALAAASLLANAFVYPVLSLATSWLDTPPALYSWVMLVAVLAAHVVALRHIDERPWSDVAVHPGAWRSGALLRGTLAGSAAIGVVIVLLLATGGAQFATVADGSGIADWSVVALRALWLLAPAALWEELVFRGYLWRVAEDAGGRRVALVSTSIAFGAVHLTNPGANVQSLGIVVLAGVCLGVIRSATDSVPAAWIAHLAWNWVMAAVAHAPVSGLPVEALGWRFTPSGPEWWSGGAWGPEGGLAAMLVLVLGLAWYARRHPRNAAPDAEPRGAAPHAEPRGAAPHAELRGATPRADNIRSQSAAVASSGS